MSFQDILQKIIEQATKEAELIKNNAEQKAKEEEDKILIENELRKEKLFKDVEEKKSKAIKKSKYLAEFEGKNNIINKKREIIKSIFSVIVNKLSSIPAKEYEEILSNLMRQIHVNDGILYPAVGKENSTKGAAKISKKNFKIGESINIKGGFKIISTNADYDYSFETLINKTFSRELEKIIIQELFT